MKIHIPQLDNINKETLKKLTRDIIDISQRSFLQNFLKDHEIAKRSFIYKQFSYYNQYYGGAGPVYWKLSKEEKEKIIDKYNKERLEKQDKALDLICISIEPKDLIDSYMIHNRDLRKLLGVLKSNGFKKITINIDMEY